jgi:DNA-binding HxlR family transcriptional regulator
MPRPTKKKPLSLTNCSIALAAEMIGDRWTLLLLRELFHGTTRFGEFAEILGAARNLLSERLQRLEQNGLVERFALEESPGREGYRLTSMGEATFPLIVALMQWGDDWLAGNDGAPMIMRDRRSGQDVGAAVLPVDFITAAGARNSADVELLAGPGARRGTRARMAVIASRRLSKKSLSRLVT